MLRYTTDISRLVRHLASGAGQFLQPRSPHVGIHQLTAVKTQHCSEFYCISAHHNLVKLWLSWSKVDHESIGGCSSPSFLPWVGRRRTTNVCDVWPVRRQTYGYLPSRKALPPIVWYQIILLSDRGTCVFTTCPDLHSTAGQCNVF